MGKIYCSVCLYDDSVAGIHFDSEGVCNYCRMIEDIQREYKTETPEGKQTFDKIVEDVRAEGKNKPYDCIVGVSGGVDSSYMLHMLKREYGLRPLAVHYDNTWNTGIASDNIKKMLSQLDIDLYTHVVDSQEMDSIYRAFFKASVPDLDAATDIALAEVMYRAAAKYNTKYIFEGHSYKTEGISPLGTFYFDGKYIESVAATENVKIKTFPNMTISSFLKWITFYRIKKIRPFWYLKYNKQDAQAFLEKNYDWQYYGGHHLENRMTAFYHSYYLHKKFGIDSRHNSLSAMVRSGLLSKEEAMEVYSTPPVLEEGLLEVFLKRLNLSQVEFDSTMVSAPKTYQDFKTYKRTFEKMRPFFYIMYKLNLVPRSFYEKYTKRTFSE